MTIRYDKRAILTRAKDLLASGREEDLRYASLELRMCIERICYDKLMLYQKQIPKELLETWQPQKVVKSLLEYAPNIEKDFKLTCEEDKNGTPIGGGSLLGEHKAITLEFISETYHRLGNCLHIPTIAQQKRQKQQDTDKLRHTLNNIASQLEELCLSTIDSNFGGKVITFECYYCKNIVVRNKESLDKNNFLVCPECKAEYKFSHDGKTAMFEPQQESYHCPYCSEEHFIGKHLLKEGDIIPISCKRCALKFILEREWILKKT